MAKRLPLVFRGQRWNKGVVCGVDVSVATGAVVCVAAALELQPHLRPSHSAEQGKTGNLTTVQGKTHNLATGKTRNLTTVQGKDARPDHSAGGTHNLATVQ